MQPEGGSMARFYSQMSTDSAARTLSEWTSGPSILRLPSEILTRILEYVVLRQEYIANHRGSRDIYDKRAALNVVATCWRFYHHAAHFIYHSIDIESDARLIEDRDAINIHDTLEKYPWLAQSCRILTVNIQGLPGLVSHNLLHYIADYVVGLLVNVKWLHVNGPLAVTEEEDEGSAWCIVRQAATHMSGIEHLEVNGYLTGVQMNPLLKDITFPTLRSLRIGGGWFKGDIDKSNTKRPNFSEFSLIAFDGQRQDLEILLSWPTTLTSFHFKHFRRASSRTDQSLDLPVLTTMLAPHKETLRNLKIGALGHVYGVGRLSDFSTFTALEELSLSRWQLGGHGLAFKAEDAGLLLAPNLRKFILNLPDGRKAYYQYSKGHVTGKEERWIRGFAQAAVDRKAKLAEIHVKCPTNPPVRRVYEVYPWDCMDNLNAVFGPQGIAITYDRVVISRDQWDALPGPSDPL